MASTSKEMTQYYANHRWFVIGGLAAAAGAVMAAMQLRKGGSVGIGATVTPVASGIVGSGPTQLQPTGFGVSDLTAAMQAGASSAATGLQYGSDLGQSAMGLAGSVVSDQANVAETLAGTQAGMGSSFVDLLKSLLPTGLPVPTQPAPPPPPPTPPPLAPRSTVFYHTQPGDTIGMVAAKFGKSWQDICSANSLGPGCNSDGTLPVAFQLVIP